MAAVEVLDTEGVRRRWSFRATSTTDTRTLNVAVVDRPDDDSGALAGPAPRFSHLCAERLGPRDVLGACAAFVTEESEHVGFFRSVILWENADEAIFERLAQSAFPALEWADGVWRGLGHFSRPYIEVGTSWSAVWVASAITVRRASMSITSTLLVLAECAGDEAEARKIDPTRDPGRNLEPANPLHCQASLGHGRGRPE